MVASQSVLNMYSVGFVVSFVVPLLLAMWVLDADDRALPQPDYLEILTNLGPGGPHYFRCQFCHMALRLWSRPFALRYLLAMWHDYVIEEQTRRYELGYRAACREQLAEGHRFTPW